MKLFRAIRWAWHWRRWGYWFGIRMFRRYG